MVPVTTNQSNIEPPIKSVAKCSDPIHRIRPDFADNLHVVIFNSWDLNDWSLRNPPQKITIRGMPKKKSEIDFLGKNI